MTEPRPIFLTARWRHLAMLHYEVDPALLSPDIPAGTELDCDVNAVYGEKWVSCLRREPDSAFVADGSKVIVRRGAVLQ